MGDELGTGMARLVERCLALKLVVHVGAVILDQRLDDAQMAAGGGRAPRRQRERRRDAGGGGGLIVRIGARYFAPPK